MYTIREDEQDPEERSKWKDVNQLIWVDTVGLDDADLEGKKVYSNPLSTKLSYYKILRNKNSLFF